MKKDYSSVPKPEIPEMTKLAIATYELEWWMRKMSRKQVREEIKKGYGWAIVSWELTTDKDRQREADYFSRNNMMV